MTSTNAPGLFGELLHRYRLAAGVSQEELAERAGLSRRGISDLERGLRRSPHPSTVHRLVEALNLQADARADLLVSASDAADHRSASRSLPLVPVLSTSFVGRTRELAEVKRLLRSARLLTLTGVGGSGKTRLAFEAAVYASQDDYPNAVALVLLAPLANPKLVAPAIAQVLSVRERSNLPLREALVAYLRPRRLLLVLDNFEHLLEAAPVVGDLLAACPRLVVLATSREALRLREEYEFLVPPLELPPLDRGAPSGELLQCASVELFVQRAAQVVPDFRVTPASVRTVADICLRLDGLPLAIELAAVRAKVLSPALLLERLEHRLPLLVGGARDLPARQQTLRDTIAWSHDLLIPSDQRLFRRLGVFAGGCTLEAVEALGEAGSDPGWTVLDGLASLVAKNLLQRKDGPEGETRFVMLETIREFALEQLQAAWELDETREAHAAYYLGWLTTADPGRSRVPRRGWVHRLDSEYDNLRAAVRWSLDHRDFPPVVSAGLALTRYGHLRGYLRELRAWWLEVLECGIGADPGLRATAAFQLAIVLFLQGEDGQVLELLEESYACFRELGDRWGMAHALLQLASTSPRAADPGAAVPLLREAEALFRALGEHEDVAWSLWCLGNLAQLQGDDAAAEALYTEGLSVVRGVAMPTSIAQAIGLEGLECNMLEGLASVELRREEFGRAESFVREATLLSADLASADHVAICALEMAGAALGRGDAMRAARLLGAAQGLWGAVASGIVPVYRPIYDHLCTGLRQRLGERAFGSARDRGRRMSRAETAALVLQQHMDPVADPLSVLTRREREVARIAARGLTNRQIAQALGLAEGTARVHVERILGKLGLHSRAQLAAWAADGGVIPG